MGVQHLLGREKEVRTVRGREDDLLLDWVQPCQPWLG